MHAGADITRRVWRTALLRRAPGWLAGALPWCALKSPLLVAWLLWCAADGLLLRRRVMRCWTSWLDDAVPELEDSSALLVQAASPLARLQRQRLLDRIAGTLTQRELWRIAGARIGFGAPPLAVGLAGAALVFFWPAQSQPVAARVPRVAASVAPELRLRVTPPAYTGVAPFTSAPRDLQAPEDSVVEWCLDKPEAATIELSDGQSLKLANGCARWSAAESMFWRWRGARYNLRVTPDQPPEITVNAPSEMVHDLAPGATSAAIALAVRDDYAVSRATLHLTLARGNGENIRFSDREMPLPASADPRLRNWSRRWTLAELGMEPGDELYFFVRATDNAGRAHTVQSATYTLRLPAPAAAEDEQASALPTLVKPESLRSQRQIIIDTEQLLADMKAAKVSTAALRERSESIAADEGALRRRYGQFLGEESTLFGADEHEHEGTKQDVLHEFGHAHDQPENATLFDEATKKVLRRALAAMWDAEKSLRAIAPKNALPPEYKALDAIKELQQADRIYLHKAAFTPPAIKEDKRLTGDVVGAASYKREQASVPQAVPADLRALVQALATDGPLPALWMRTAHEWVRAHVSGDEQRLQAQRAIQDVADGCVACRPVLRAWLRGAIAQPPVLLQARPAVQTAFVKAWAK